MLWQEAADIFTAYQLNFISGQWKELAWSFPEWDTAVVIREFFTSVSYYFCENDWMKLMKGEHFGNIPLPHPHPQRLWWPPQLANGLEKRPWAIL